MPYLECDTCHRETYCRVQDAGETLCCACDTERADEWPATQIASRLAEALSRVPTNPSAKNVDPAPCVQCVAACGQLISVVAGDPDDLKTARRVVWRAAAAAAYEMMSTVNYARQTTVGVTLGALVFLAAMRLCWAIERTMRDEVATRRVADLVECVTQRTVHVGLVNREVASFTCRELITSVQVLRTAFVECTLTPALVEYVELLEMRAARFLFETGNAAMLDEPDLRTAIDGADDEFRVNQSFIDVAWPSFLGFQRALIFARCSFDVNTDLTAADGDDARAVDDMCSLLLELNNRHPCRDQSPSLKEHFIRMHLAPGDRELFRLQSPSASRSDAGVVGELAGDARLSDINRRARLSPHECLRALLTPEARAARRYEPLELGLCLHDFLNAITQDSPGCAWARHYSCPQPVVQARVLDVQQQSFEYPMVVQLFNHWQLVYANRVYWYNSYVRSLVAWSRMMALQRTEPLSSSPVYVAAARSEVFDRFVAVVSAGYRAPEDATALALAASSSADTNAEIYTS